MRILWESDLRTDYVQIKEVLPKFLQYISFQINSFAEISKAKSDCFNNRLLQSQVTDVRISVYLSFISITISSNSVPLFSIGFCHYKVPKCSTVTSSPHAQNSTLCRTYGFETILSFIDGPLSVYHPLLISPILHFRYPKSFSTWKQLLLHTPNTCKLP